MAALVSAVLDQLASFIQQELEHEVRLVVGTRKEVHKLSTSFSLIQAVLEDAEKKQVKEKLVQLWLEKLKDVAYDMDDILDEWNTKILRSQIEGGKKKVCSYLFSTCFCFKHVFLRHKIGYRIKDVRERLDEITSEKDKFDFKSGRRTEVVEERPMTSSLIDISDICGRDMDKNIIISKLLSESSQQEIGLPIISITGMGGLGKTTLARLVFNDDKVKNHFEKTMWVCVSDPFDNVRIAKAIIEAVDGHVPNVIEWDALLHKLSDSVRGKKFLLVLDDVWTEDQTKWDPLKFSLKNGAQGSRIVVTTRNEKVAVMMGTTNPYRLGQLSDEDCWLLIRRVAFGGMREEECEKLSNIGKEITKKCRGVPLVAKTLGSLLQFKRTKQDWQTILESETWDLPEVEKEILPALLLSYYDFPSQLKSCFAYCAIFPKDYIIKKDMLITMWMAQGFVSHVGRKELEIIGGEYFDNLVMRSFFQDFKKDEDGKITHCKMHDLVHDLAQFLTKNECFITKINNTELNPNMARHLTLWDDVVEIDSFPPSFRNAKNLRTLQLFGGLPSVIALSNLFNCLTCLRALDLSYQFTYENLPSEIENLIHLRYLDLSGTKLKKLPETMSNLYNLQTLKLNKCSRLCKLPKCMGKLINLRHLEIEGTDALSYLPQGIGRLSSLRTLSKFIVGGVSGGCKIGELKDLNSLKGSLTINGLKRLENVNNAKEAELKNKQHLSGLDLIFDCNDELTNVNDIVERMEGVLEGLQPHRNLESLSIFKYPGSKFPSWMTRDSMLSNLLCLELANCNNCIELTALKKLSSLEVLRLCDMDEVKNIGREFYEIGRGGKKVVFPKLKKLWFKGMNNLEDWELGVEDGIEIMPCLSELTLEGCPKLKALPALGKLASLKKLDIRQMGAIKSMGNELYGVSNGSVSGKALVVFPKLEELCIEDMLNLEEWVLPMKNGETMPRLCRMYLRRCPKLKVLPAVGKLAALETLIMKGMASMERLGPEFCGISDDDDELTTKSQGGESVVIFPKLKELGFYNMKEWEEWEMMRRREDEDEDKDVVGGGTDTIIMPCLLDLQLAKIPKLKLLPYYLPRSLRRLGIFDCPELTWRTPCHCLFPLLETLFLICDAGVLSRSLPFLPNLKYLSIQELPHSSFPQGLAQLKALQVLSIIDCSSLMSMPEELKHLTTLQELCVTECPVLKRRCEKEVGEDWSIISHIPNINFETDMVLVENLRARRAQQAG